MLTKLHILWASVTPSLETGYGRVTYHVVSRLLDAGIDVICYGLQTYGTPQGLVVKGKMFPMVGTEDAEYEAPVIEKMKKHMADHGRNTIISLWDVWNLPVAFPDNFPTWIPYIPLDAAITVENYYITRNAFRRIAMSRFGHDQFASVGLDTTTILHGVDTQTYRPMPEIKDVLRAKYGFKKDVFVVGWVGKNYYDRKRPDLAIQIFSQFIKRHNIKDAVLYMHTEPVPCKEFCGFNIRRLAELCEVQDLVLTPSRTAVPDQELAEIYGCMDVLLHTSMAEGFGLPLAEAQACGVPVICADNSSQPELVVGHGWVIPCYEWDCRLTTPLHNKWWIIDIDGAVDAIEEAYSNRSILKEYGEQARKFIVDNYDWTAIIEDKWLPFLEGAERDMLKHPMLRNWIIGMKARNVK